MHLILKASSPPPSKKSCEQPNPKIRGEWSNHFETITSWFCSSHDFHKEGVLVILLHNEAIELKGKNIRYLGPSLRSAASLIYKAYNQLKKIEHGTSESTPGIYVYKDVNDLMFPLPHYFLGLKEKISTFIPTFGTFFTFKVKHAEEYYVPASTVGQGVIWLLQEINLKEKIN